MKPAIHGRDHRSGGSDPIAELRDAIRFNVDNEGGYLLVVANDHIPADDSSIRMQALEDGTLAAWSATSGTSVVDDPFPQSGSGFDETFFVEGIRYECLPGQDIDTGVPNIRMELDVSPQTFYSHNPWGTTVDGDT